MSCVIYSLHKHIANYCATNCISRDYQLANTKKPVNTKKDLTPIKARLAWISLDAKSTCRKRL